jgi:hypothetical protein
MNLSIEQTELIVQLLNTEIGYWSAPEHEEVAHDFVVLKKTFERSLRAKKSYQNQMSKIEKKLEDLES